MILLRFNSKSNQLTSVYHKLLKSTIRTPPPVNNHPDTSFVNQSIDWHSMIDWLIDSFIPFSIIRLIDWLIDWFKYPWCNFHDSRMNPIKLYLAATEREESEGILNTTSTLHLLLIMHVWIVERSEMRTQNENTEMSMSNIKVWMVCSNEEQ